MNEKRVKSLVEILKTTIRELEDEVKSDTDFFIRGARSADYLDARCFGGDDTHTAVHGFDYSEILSYYNTQDDDGDPD